MEPYFDDFTKIIKAFEDNEVEYILIGGFAVILHGYPRFTQDMDVFVKLAPQNVERLKNALQSVYHDPFIAEIRPEDMGDYAVVRYVAPNGFMVDIISRIGEMFQYDDLAYESLQFEGLTIKVATAETLLKLKKDTLRDKDKMDVVFLRQLIAERKKESS